MAERIVLSGPLGALNLRAATVFWGEVAGDGPTARTKVHLRWMLSPWVGLPANPFELWRGRHPGGMPTKHDLANDLDWELVEVVGLPVDDRFAATAYPLAPQGLRGDPRDPVDAAVERVARGAPARGWRSGPAGRPPLPDWAEAAPDLFVHAVLGGRLYETLPELLALPPNMQIDHEVKNAIARETALRLLLHEGAGVADGDTSRALWQPLPVLLLNVGSDPLAALAFGFGTALEELPDDDALFMVTLAQPGLATDRTLEFADVARPAPFGADPATPAPFTELASMTRPQRTDGAAIDSVAIRWPLAAPPMPPPDAITSPAPEPVAYAVVRYGPGSAEVRLLNRPRPDGIGGIVPHVPSAAHNLGTFVDHLSRSGTSDANGRPRLTGATVTYAVAAQDLFGRYSDWAEVSHTVPPEGPYGPLVVGVEAEDDGALTVILVWDWTERSPAFVEIEAFYADAPGVPIASARLEFAGSDAPAASAGTVTPLGSGREPVASYGAAQDPETPFGGIVEPGVRTYRWTTAVPIDFVGRPWREIDVVARGQARLHRDAFNAPWNLSPWTEPRRARVWNPARPPAPATQAPAWGSLPDRAGVSRALLTWPAVAGAAGWHVFEATETALLAVLGHEAAPDLEGSFVTRLAALEGAVAARIHDCRTTFRRLTTEPLAADALRYEAALPRGSRVIHAFVVIAVNANGLESDWAGATVVYVAAPRVRPPAPPVVAASALVGPPRAEVRVEPGPRTAMLEIFRGRGSSAPPLGDMGPPIATFASGGAETFEDTAVVPGWTMLWYRAVGWSAREDAEGFVAARSRASVDAPVLVPPEGPPRLTSVTLDAASSTIAFARIVFELDAPLGATPLGSHRVVVERTDGGGRVEASLDAVPLTSAAAPPIAPAEGEPGTIIAIGPSGPTRLAAWVARASGPFSIRIKAVDPLGRIGEAELQVSP